jgi:hypothetical protein
VEFGNTTLLDVDNGAAVSGNSDVIRRDAVWGILNFSTIGKILSIL